MENQVVIDLTRRRRRVTVCAEQPQNTVVISDSENELSDDLQIMNQWGQFESLCDSTGIAQFICKLLVHCHNFHALMSQYMYLHRNSCILP